MDEVTPYRFQSPGLNEQPLWNVESTNNVRIDKAQVRLQTFTVLKQETPQLTEQPKGRRHQNCAKRDNNNNDINTPAENDILEDSDNERKVKKSIRVHYSKRNSTSHITEKKNGVIKKVHKS